MLLSKPQLNKQIKYHEKLGKGWWKRAFIEKGTANGYPEETNKLWSSDNEIEASCHRELYVC